MTLCVIPAFHILPSANQVHLRVACLISSSEGPSCLLSVSGTGRVPAGDTSSEMRLSLQDPHERPRSRVAEGLGADRLRAVPQSPSHLADLGGRAGGPRHLARDSHPWATGSHLQGRLAHHGAEGGAALRELRPARESPAPMST